MLALEMETGVQPRKVMDTGLEAAKRMVIELFSFDPVTEERGFLTYVRSEDPVVQLSVPGDTSRLHYESSTPARLGVCSMAEWVTDLNRYNLSLSGDFTATDFCLTGVGLLRGKSYLFERLKWASSPKIKMDMSGLKGVTEEVYKGFPMPRYTKHFVKLLSDFKLKNAFLVRFHVCHEVEQRRNRIFNAMYDQLMVIKYPDVGKYRKILDKIAAAVAKDFNWMDTCGLNTYLSQLLNYNSEKQENTFICSVCKRAKLTHSVEEDSKEPPSVDEASKESPSVDEASNEPPSVEAEYNSVTILLPLAITDSVPSETGGVQTRYCKEIYSLLDCRRNGNAHLFRDYSTKKQQQQKGGRKKRTKAVLGAAAEEDAQQEAKPSEGNPAAAAAEEEGQLEAKPSEGNPAAATEKTLPASPAPTLQSGTTILSPHYGALTGKETMEVVEDSKSSKKKRTRISAPEIYSDVNLGPQRLELYGGRGPGIDVLERYKDMIKFDPAGVERMFSATVHFLLPNFQEGMHEADLLEKLELHEASRRVCLLTT